MDRRNFLAVMPGLYPATLLSDPGPDVKQGRIKIPDGLATIPNFCTHEHWGSIDSIGHVMGMYNADAFAGALPRFPTSLFHLLVDPYMSANLYHAGRDPGKYKTDENTVVDLIQLASETPARALSELSRLLEENRLTGTYLATKRGIEILYDCLLDLEDLSMLETLNEVIAAHYRNPFEWYQKGMRKVGFTGLIRPVHPEFYFTLENDHAAQELSFTKTVMRIDPLLSFWKDSERKEKLFGKLGLEARDAGSWRRFLEKLITIAREAGCVGIKQLQAYRRDLDFEKAPDGRVKFTGELKPADQLLFENWVVNECCKLANDLKWPHQIHVGTHNLPDSNPLPLKKMALNYPDQKIIQIHCWPYQREAGHLAKSYANVYLDTCWQVVLNPEYLRESLSQWLHYVLLHKITMGNDSTSIEMAAGSSLIARTILMDTLDHHFSAWYVSENRKLDIAFGFMHNNAVDVYGFGEKKCARAEDPA